MSCPIYWIAVSRCSYATLVDLQNADEPKKYQNSDIMKHSRIPRELIQQLLESSDKILIFNFPLIFNLKMRKYYCKKSIVGLGLITSKIIHNLCPFANSMGYFLFAQKSHELFYADFWAFCTCCIVWKGSVKIIFLQRSVLRIRENRRTTTWSQGLRGIFKF